MKDTGLINEGLKEAISQEVAFMGMDLLDLFFSGGVLRLTIDRPGGVTLDDCVAVTKRVSVILDAKDPIPEGYRLEVSSPGLDRVLRRPEEFVHFSGRKVKVVTKGETYRGLLKGLDGNQIVVELKGKDVKIDLGDITKARLDF